MGRIDPKTKLTLAEEEPGSVRGRVLVALGVQCPRDRGWAAEEYANVGIWVLLGHRGENSVPVWSTEMGWGLEGRDRILLGSDILDLTKQ